MTIRQISLNNFRNLRSTTVDLNTHFNIITGLNASGKTSFLEALHILCQGRSFRTHSIDQCIQHSQNNFLLFSVFDSYKAGVSRSDKETSIRINNETINKISLLAEKTPVRTINSSCFNLVLGSPKYKREYIDWCLFHVEHNYISLWVEYKHALKQRNALLKLKRNLDQLAYWDNHLSSLSLKIYGLRLKYINRIKNIFTDEFSNLLKDFEIDINYEPGWNTEEPLENILLSNRERDIKYGFTRFGSHRDDILILSNGHPVQHVLSRGQLKKLSILLYLAQIMIVRKFTDKTIVLLIDDLESELDSFTVDSILTKLVQLKLQIFITSIESSFNLSKHHEEYTMFHVEHGMIKPVKNL